MKEPLPSSSVGMQAQEDRRRASAAPNDEAQLRPANVGRNGTDGQPPGVSLREDRPSAPDELTAAIRRVIREELDGSPQTSTPAVSSRKHRRETLGLLLLFFNVVLIYTWLPEEVRSSDNVDFITKLITLVGGGFAITNPALFRKSLAEIGKRKSFIAANLGVFLLVTVARFVPLPLKLNTEPPDAWVSVDDQPPIEADISPGFFRTLGNHKIQVSPPKGGIKIGVSPVAPRGVDLHWARQLWYSLPFVPPPKWPLLAHVDLWFSPIRQYTVKITSLKYPFDYEFLHSTSNPNLTFLDNKTAMVTLSEPKEQEELLLPFGEYNLEASITTRGGQDKHARLQPCAPAVRFVLDKEHHDGEAKFASLRCQ